MEVILQLDSWSWFLTLIPHLFSPFTFDRVEKLCTSSLQVATSLGPRSSEMNTRGRSYSKLKKLKLTLFLIKFCRGHELHFFDFPFCASETGQHMAQVIDQNTFRADFANFAYFLWNVLIFYNFFLTGMYFFILNFMNFLNFLLKQVF